eukprot:5554404-Pleurochrysis_carterae.AAC.3
MSSTYFRVQMMSLRQKTKPARLVEASICESLGIVCKHQSRFSNGLLMRERNEDGNSSAKKDTCAVLSQMQRPRLLIRKKATAVAT